MPGLLSAVGLAMAVSLLAAATGSNSQPRDWPSFRGPSRTGVANETGLLHKWPEGGPRLVWEARGAGLGYASTVIAGGRLFTLGDAPSTGEDKDEFLLAFHQETGKPLWKHKTGPAWTSGKQPTWKSSRSTPTVDGDRVYVLTAHGELVCCDAATGKEHWRKSVANDLGGKKGDGWGYSESVLIDGEKLVCTPGGEKATMVALDKKTGDVIWTCVREGDRGAGHASIVISDIGGTRVYVQSTASGPLGVRASDGKLLWSYEIEKTTAVIPTPIVRGDLVYFVAGYQRGGALLKQIPQPNGEVKVEEVYPLNKKLANKHGGTILVGDYLYAGSEDKAIVFCADLMTGEIKWEGRPSGHGSVSMVAADGDLYIHVADGTMVLAKATPDGYEEVGSFTVPGSGERPSWSHPIVLDGKLYVREQDHILCYDVRAKK